MSNILRYELWYFSLIVLTEWNASNKEPSSPFALHWKGFVGLPILELARLTGRIRNGQGGRNCHIIHEDNTLFKQPIGINLRWLCTIDIKTKTNSSGFWVQWKYFTQLTQSLEIINFKDVTIRKLIRDCKKNN